MAVRSAGAKGDGAFAAADCAAGRWVCQYVGAPTTLLQTAQRYTDADPAYLFQITPELYLDAMDSTHVSRYFNHAYPAANLNFTVDKAAREVHFYAARDIAAGEELTFDYGTAYWLGSGVHPSAETDSRNYSALEAQSKRPLPPPPPGPKPLTPTSMLSEVEAAMALPPAEARTALLRTLEYFGAERLDVDALRIPRGLGPDAPPSEVVDPGTVPLATLESAARACIIDLARIG